MFFLRDAAAAKSRSANDVAGGARIEADSKIVALRFVFLVKWISISGEPPAVARPLHRAAELHNEGNGRSISTPPLLSHRQNDTELHSCIPAVIDCKKGLLVDSIILAYEELLFDSNTVDQYSIMIDLARAFIWCECRFSA
jgi:hypothetical protein